MSFTDSHGNTVDLPDGAVVAWRVSSYAVVEDDGTFLMVQSGNGLWHFPGGGVEQSEMISDAVIRECKEETGYSILPVDGDQPVYFREQQFYHSGEQQFYHSIQIFYQSTLAKASPDISSITDHDKSRQVAWVSLDDLNPANTHPTVLELVEKLRK